MKYTSVICIGLLVASLGGLPSSVSAVEVEMGINTEAMVEAVAPANPAVQSDSVESMETVVEPQKVDVLPVPYKAPIDSDPMNAKSVIKEGLEGNGPFELKDIVIDALSVDGMPLFVPETDEDVVVMEANTRFTKGIESGWVIFPEWHHLAIVEDKKFVIPFVHGTSDTDIYYHLSLLEYHDEYGDITFHGSYMIGQDVADLLVKTKDGIVNISYKDVSADRDKPVGKNVALKLDGQRFVLAK